MTAFDVRGEPVTLVINQGDYAGVEFESYVRVGMTEHFRLGRLLDRAMALESPSATDEEVDEYEKVVGEAVDILMPRVVSWNLDSGGEPVPVTRDGALSLPLPALAAVIVTWRASIGKVLPPPLAQRPTSSPSTGSSSASGSSRRARGTTRTSSSPSSAAR